MGKLSRMERAKQFAPFASLRGYGKIIRNTERVITPKRELTEEENDALNQVFPNIKKGDMIEITHYVSDGYEKTQGVITFIDKTMRRLTVVKTEIKFDDILSVKIID